MLDYVDDELLAAEISAAQLVVLPYREHAQLRRAAAGAVACGARCWCRPTRPPGRWPPRSGRGGCSLPGAHADRGRPANRAGRDGGRPGGGPDLTARDWSTIGAQHVRAYRAAASRGRRASASEPDSAGSPSDSAPDAATAAAEPVDPARYAAARPPLAVHHDPEHLRPGGVQPDQRLADPAAAGPAGPHHQHGLAGQRGHRCGVGHRQQRRRVDDHDVVLGLRGVQQPSHLVAGQQLARVRRELTGRQHAEPAVAPLPDRLVQPRRCRPAPRTARAW